MKKTYLKPEMETAIYSCTLLTETMSTNFGKTNSGDWDTGSKERDDAEAYINEQEGTNSTNGWSDGLW